MRYDMLTDPAYGTYVAMQCLLIIPPSFLALVGYITLGRAIRDIRLVNPSISDFMKPKLIMWLYFLCEIASLALQGAGAGISVSKTNGGGASSKTAGKVLLIMGLAFLVIIIFTFMLNAIYVHRRPEYGIMQSRSMSRLFLVLYITTALLMVRNVFRLIEFADGFYGSISTKEVYFYCLDSLMVVLILFIEGIFNFGYFLNGYQKEIANKAKSTADISMV